MVVPAVFIPVGMVVFAVTVLVVLAISVGVGYRRHSGSTGRDDTEESEQSGATAGFPLASWRYVYDVDKADANREITSVQQQAEDIAEADRKARR